jgi:hypothetical protein
VFIEMRAVSYASQYPKQSRFHDKSLWFILCGQMKANENRAANEY